MSYRTAFAIIFGPVILMLVVFLAKAVLMQEHCLDVPRPLWCRQP